MRLDALDVVLRDAASVLVSEIEWYGDVVVDLTRPGTLDGLRAAMAVQFLTGAVCACMGQVRFQFFDARSERLTALSLHGASTISWYRFTSHAGIPRGLLLRWLEEHGLPDVLLHDHERPEWRAWEAAMPSVLRDMAPDLMRHQAPSADSRHVVEARRRTRNLDCGVLELLAWSGSSQRTGTRYPPYEDVPGLILQDVPIADVVAALEQGDERHDAGLAHVLLVGKSRVKQRMNVARLPGPIRVRVREAVQVRGYAVPDWAERLLLNA